MPNKQRIKRRINVKLIVSLSLLLFVVLVGILGPLFYRVNPLSVVGRPGSPPSEKHPLGTDARGRDVLAQLLLSTRTSVFIGTIAACISLAIGVLVGVTAGYKGGILDDVLMLITNIMLTLPPILLLLLVAVFIAVRSRAVVAVLIGLTSWPWVARAVRAQIMSLKERQFVLLTKMAGFNSLRIVLGDLLPNMYSYIVMAFVLLMSGAILAEAGISMIGVGLTEGTSLGVMLFWAQSFEAVRRGLYWWFVPPGVLLVCLTSSLLLLSTALDEYFNPRLRER